MLLAGKLESFPEDQTSSIFPLYRGVILEPGSGTRDFAAKCFVTVLLVSDSAASFGRLGAVTRRSAPCARSLARSIAACERPPYSRDCIRHKMRRINQMRFRDAVASPES